MFAFASCRYKILTVSNTMEQFRAWSIYGKLKDSEDCLKATVLTVLALFQTLLSNSIATSRRLSKFLLVTLLLLFPVFVIKTVFIFHVLTSCRYYFCKWLKLAFKSESVFIHCFEARLEAPLTVRRSKNASRLKPCIHSLRLTPLFTEAINLIALRLFLWGYKPHLNSIFGLF